MNERSTTQDFSTLHAAMQRWADSDLLAGVSVAVLIGRDRLHTHCVGFADKERGVALRDDHLFRVFSNTKLVTGCAAMALHEDGRFDFDDPIERFLPALAHRHVLRPGARTIDDAVPARGPITIRHLLTHTSGLSYGLFDPGTTLFKAYGERRIHAPDTTLEQMVDALGTLPLAFEPGEGWEYSMATDVVARLVEVCSGQRFDRFIAERILQPLGMNDTGFVVPQSQRDRLAAMYIGADLVDPLKPGLRRAEQLMAPNAHLQRVARLSGGGGLVSSLGDTVALLRALMPGEPTLLKPATIERMSVNQLPAGRFIRFPGIGELTGKGHGLVSGVVVAPAASEHPESAGEWYWGGMAGTQWWIAPRHGFAGALMTQRWMGYGDPFVADLKREVYRAVLGR
ncbi:MAG TPA: serine hydrolase domain-containing protein [Burkholderiaceae bacterium]|nr:serine hydrolase domain-containing protein [Burkholderiaceae bacterium]